MINEHMMPEGCLAQCIAFSLLTQQPRVQISAPGFFFRISDVADVDVSGLLGMGVDSAKLNS